MGYKSAIFKHDDTIRMVSPTYIGAYIAQDSGDMYIRGSTTMGSWDHVFADDPTPGSTPINVDFKEVCRYGSIFVAPYDCTVKYMTGTIVNNHTGYHNMMLYAVRPTDGSNSTSFRGNMVGGTSGYARTSATTSGRIYQLSKSWTDDNELQRGDVLVLAWNSTAASSNVHYFSVSIGIQMDD